MSQPLLLEPSLSMDVDDAAPLRVLVVDDCPDTVWSTVELLRLGGYDAFAASTGRGGLGAAARTRPDVVLLDLGLPDVDGYEVARVLRARAAPKRPLLIAVTGYGTDGDRAKTAAAGFDLHLTKPVAPDDLLRVLARFARVLGR